MSNIYLSFTIEEKLTLSKLRFSQFKKPVTRSVFGELQLTQMPLNFKTSYCNLKIKVWEQSCGWLFYYSKFEKNHDVLTSKSPCILLNKNINFIKNETEAKMENPTHRFRVMSCRNSRPEVFCKKGVLKDFAKFIGKHLCQRLFF